MEMTMMLSVDVEARTVEASQGIGPPRCDALHVVELYDAAAAAAVIAVFLRLFRQALGDSSTISRLRTGAISLCFIVRIARRNEPMARSLEMEPLPSEPPPRGMDEGGSSGMRTQSCVPSIVIRWFWQHSRNHKQAEAETARSLLVG
uniref:Uncharacterized protein n=1 Tax=Coccidioides posadasii RMSCC 3488 TaxID=454284 RepID=A0A0J6IE83_COCPO|nr:hypothetical protein CPAG_06379 [Coccidioides posadasii RMSCC 3488]